MDDETKPIIVRTNQGGIDMLTAAFRLVGVIISTAPVAALLIRKGDLIGLYDYFHTNQGVALSGALVGLASMGYGLYKSRMRGGQIASVATDPNVPNSVADVK